MSIWDVPANTWAVVRKFEELMALHKKIDTALEGINDRLQTLEDRMTHLEAAQGQMTSEARAAAGMAATAMASSIIADVVTRVTRLEMRQEHLPPP